MNITTTTERWATFWKSATDPTLVERKLRRLRWLDEFAFYCGSEISQEWRDALARQIDNGSRRLSHLEFESAKESATDAAEHFCDAKERFISA